MCSKGRHSEVQHIQAPLLGEGCVWFCCPLCYKTGNIKEWQITEKINNKSDNLEWVSGESENRRVLSTEPDAVESDDKTLETSLTLLTFVLLPYKEGPDQTDFIFEIAEYDYIYISSYFTSILCSVYLQFLYAI